jgi:hypothetical protein
MSVAFVMENEVDGAGTAHRSRVDHWEAGVNVLSVVLGEQKTCRWTEDFLLVSDKET